jgi:hypothetical protein
MRLALAAPLRELSASQRQMVEILKALAVDAKVIIFDEPTAWFSPNEVDRLFDVMRLLIQDGKALVFVSHRHEEIFEITDRTTVFREGRVVADAVPTTEMRPAELIRFVVGREIADIYARGILGRGAPARPDRYPDIGRRAGNSGGAPRRLGPARGLRWGARIHRSDPPGKDRRLGNAATVPHGCAVRTGDVRSSRGQETA